MVAARQIEGLTNLHAERMQALTQQSAQIEALQAQITQVRV